MTSAIRDAAPATSPDQRAAKGVGSSAPPQQTGAAVLRSMRDLGSKSLIYVVADILVRGASILLVPLYTHAMTPRDYGILAVTTSVSFIMTVLLSLSLDSAITRLTLELDAEEQRSLYGSVLLFFLVVPPVILGVLEIVGQSGALNFFKDVPYAPYLRYALWASYFTAFMYLPCGMWIARGEPRKVFRLKVLSVTVQVATGIILIVVLHQGVLGALRAFLLASATTALVSIVVMVRNSSHRVRIGLFTSALAFSVPVIPHLLAHWVLQLSDRVILQGYVSDARLGLYSLGYTAGAVASILTTNFASAVMPIIVSRLKSEEHRPEVPALGTYSLLVLTELCVIMAVFGGSAVLLITPTSYHGAAEIVPWVVVSYIFVSMYMLLSQGTWFVMRTSWIAVATCAAAAVNVGVTFWLAATMGILGAAVATVIGYAVLALFHGIVAYRLYRIPWEYGRWARIVVVGLACVLLGVAAGNQLSVGSLLLRCVVVTIIFPTALLVSGFLTEEERQWITRMVGIVDWRLRRA